MAQDPQAILEMEEQLKKDTDGTYRKQLLDQLSVSLGEIKNALDAGLAPDEFQAMNQLKDAVEDASTVVENVWNGLHG